MVSSESMNDMSASKRNGNYDFSWYQLEYSFVEIVYAFHWIFLEVVYTLLKVWGNTEWWSYQHRYENTL